METEIETQQLQPQSKKSGGVKYKLAIAVVLVVMALSTVGYELYSFYPPLNQERAWRQARLNEAAYKKINQTSYLKSFLKNDPKPLQESFSADITNGVNDKFTKSDAYFLTHRYFDNGGNVYEIYDYVNSHENLAFLKEAEQIYPGIFEQIKYKTLTPIPYSTPSLYAILAYLEVLDNHGYADIAALGTLANQYAKTAYFIKRESEQRPGGSEAAFPEANVTLSVIKEAENKAIHFEIKARDSMVKVFEENGISLDKAQRQLRPERLEQPKPLKNILPHNLLVGLNQYAAALRYLEVTGTEISVIDSPATADDLFALNMVIAKQFVPELEIFTSLLNASTFALISPQSVSDLKVALRPILDLDTSKTKPQGIVLGIINAKEHPKGFDVYSKVNVAMLGTLVPEFKAWLISNGWHEEDFRLN